MGEKWGSLMEKEIAICLFGQLPSTVLLWQVTEFLVQLSLFSLTKRKCLWAFMFLRAKEPLTTVWLGFSGRKWKARCSAF